MRFNYFRKAIIGALILGNLCTPVFSKAESLEQKVQDKTEVKDDNRARVYELSTNFLFNEIVKGGSLALKVQKNKKIKKKGLADQIILSYDHTTLNGRYREALKKEKKITEKKLLNFDYQISYNKPFIGISYSSDGSNGINTFFLIGGISKDFSNGLKMNIGAGLKSGNGINFRNEKYDVFNILLAYQTPDKKEYDINASVKMYVPRKYLTNDMSALWIFEGNAVILLEKKILGVIPGIGIGYKHDYIAVIEEGRLRNIGISWYNFTLGLNKEF